MPSLQPSHCSRSQNKQLLKLLTLMVIKLPFLHVMLKVLLLMPIQAHTLQIHSVVVMTLLSLLMALSLAQSLLKEFTLKSNGELLPLVMQTMIWIKDHNHMTAMLLLISNSPYLQSALQEATPSLLKATMMIHLPTTCAPWLNSVSEKTIKDPIFNFQC